MFVLKKVVSLFLMPLPVGFALLGAGLALIWFSHRQRLGRWLATAGFAWLFLLSLGLVSDALIGALERGFRPVLVPGSPAAVDAQARKARWIVVLGGGHHGDRTLPATSELNTTTLARLVEAVRLKRLIPEAKLVLSGGFRSNGIEHGAVLSAAAQALGVDPGAVVIEHRTLDTYDEARTIGDTVGHDPFILVSSGSHLRRAMRLCHKQGLDPIPSPADFAVIRGRGFDLGELFPSPSALFSDERALHEYLGLLWSKLRGQI